MSHKVFIFLEDLILISICKLICNNMYIFLEKNCIFCLHQLIYLIMLKHLSQIIEK